MDEQYKPNSVKYKTEHKEAPADKKVEKVVTGNVIKKKNRVRKFTDIFISEDVANVKSYVLMDVLVPAVKKAISDIVTDGIDMILYGGTGGSRKRGNNTSYVSYRSYSDRRDDRRQDPAVSRSGYSYDDIILNTRAEAEEVMLQMTELLDRYGIVSVADLYDLVGITGNYTDNHYGWTQLRSAEVIHVRDGYLLKLPRAILID